MPFNVGSIIARLGFDITGWIKGKRQVSQDVRALGMDITKLGAILTGFAGISVKEIGQFDKAIREALAVSDVTTQQFDEMAEMAENMSKQLNKAATETAKGFYFLGSAGLSATEQMQSFGSVTNMARAMTVEVGQAAEGLVDIMRGFNITFDESNRVADTLVKTVITSNQVFSDLDKAMSYVSSTANMSNNSLADVAAMLGVMANAGIKGSYAGVALRRSFTNLMSPTREMIDLIHSLGLKLYDTTNGEMRPFVDIMGDINFQLRDASDRYKNMVFEIMFGRRAIAGQIKIFEFGKEQLQQYSDALLNADGTMKNVVDKQMAAFLHQLGRVYRGIQDVAREIGRALVPSLREFANQALPVVDALKDWVKNNSDVATSIIKITTAIGGAALVIGPLMLMLPTLINSIRILSMGFAGLIGPVIVAVAGFYALRVAWDDAFKGMRDTVNDFGEKFGLFVDGFNISWSDGLNVMIETFQEFANIVWTGYGKIGVAAKMMWTVLKNNWGTFTPEELDFLKQGMEFLKTGKLEFPTISALEGSKNLGAGMLELATKDVNTLWNKIKETSPELAEFLGMLNAIVGGAPAPDLPTGGLGEGVHKGKSDGKGEDVSNVWADHWRQSIKTVMDNFTLVHKMMVDVQNDIVDGFETSFNRLLQHGSSLADGMDDIFDSILQAYITMVSRMAAQNMFYQIFGDEYQSDKILGAGEGWLDSSGIIRRPGPKESTGSYEGTYGAGKVTVINNTGMPMAAKIAPNGKDIIVDTVMEAMNTNSSFRNTMRGS